MPWHESLNAFYSANDGEPWLKVRPNGNLSFQAKVTYSTETHGAERFQTTVRVTRNGYDDGAVTLDELPDLSPPLRALFLPIPPGDCDYSPGSESLTIKGATDELGQYEVHLAPAV